MKWSCTLAKHFKEMNLAEILLGKQTEWCYKDLKAVSKTEIPLRPVLGALPGYKIQSPLQQHLWEFWVRKAKFHRQDGENKAEFSCGAQSFLGESVARGEKEEKERTINADGKYRRKRTGEKERIGIKMWI